MQPPNGTWTETNVSPAPNECAPEGAPSDKTSRPATEYGAYLRQPNHVCALGRFQCRLHSPLPWCLPALPSLPGPSRTLTRGRASKLCSLPFTKLFASLSPPLDGEDSGKRGWHHLDIRLLSSFFPSRPPRTFRWDRGSAVVSAPRSPSDSCSSSFHFGPAPTRPATEAIFSHP